MPFAVKDKKEADEGREDQKRSNRDDGVDGDVELHQDDSLWWLGTTRSAR